MSSIKFLPSGSTKSAVIKSAFGLFLSLLIGWLVFQQIYQDKIATIKAKQDEKLAVISTDFFRELSSINKLTKILAKGPLLQKGLPETGLTEQQNRDKINDYFVSFGTTSTNISQIRWLDKKGQERYRVNFNKSGWQIVEKSKLQTKQNRYYFQQGIQVKAPNTYASQIDLNIEHEAIIKPHQPTTRVTYRTNKEKYLIDGLLVVNFNLDYLFNDIKQYKQPKTHISVLNHEGFWLLNKNPQLEWGFMYDQMDNTLAFTHPLLWQQISDKKREHNSRLIDDKVYTFRRFSISSLKESKGSLSDIDKEIVILIDSHESLIKDARSVAIQFALLCSGLLCSISFFFIYREYTYQKQLLTLSHRLHIEKIELEVINRELDDTLKQQQQLQADLVEAQKLSSLGLLVAGVAHEMNTPIGGAIISVSNADMAVKKLTQAIEEGLTKSALESSILSLDENLHLAKVNLDKSAVLVKSFKKMAIDRHNDEFVLCDLKKIVEDLLITLHSRLKNSPVQVSTQFLTNKQIISRPGIISQVLENLIMNALSHGFAQSEPGEIEIKIEQNTQRDIKLTVSDSGVGISSSVTADIFEPFYTTARGKGNTGLGLYMVNQWVTKVLSGSITLYSTPQSDEHFKTQFVIILPNKA